MFCKEVLCKNGDSFFSIPLKDVRVGTYKWLRTSVAYQNYDVKIKTTSGGLMDGTVASFVGFNTYVDKFKMKNTVMTILQLQLILKMKIILKMLLKLLFHSSLL